ncbi:MAG: zinc-dependent metalloprotease [Bryobacteraceae bacterium]|nr:zinc-dependent metalloprotease [Bryobacteraceae bacterium]
MRFSAVALLLIAVTGVSSGQKISERVKDTEPLPGFLTLYHDLKAGKVWLEVSRWNTEMLYYASLPAGLGSNDVGLDRGQIGRQAIVRFERHGKRVLLVQSNTRFMASSANPDERRSVKEAFAESVLWGFENVEEEGDKVLVDATAFFLRDAHGVIDRMRTANQGAYKLEESRSAIYEPRTRSFPKNTEVEAILTFTSDNPGAFVRSVAPNAGAVTVREHHSFVELPGPGYRIRAFDPRSGFNAGATFADYSTAIGEPIVKRYSERHRLTREKPIVYYLDPGTPEPVRSALLEGARWWSQAFAAAGFPNGFRVEMLPSEADALDVRYNVIQWVHRSTRGWSYGNSVTDPRTGEIIKGHVTLGSLRVRQDFMIAEGLLSPYEEGKPVPPEMERMALARLRQLSAHEVGHTLGLTHNFASSISERASVMDYPHPLALLGASGAPDLSKAYATGIGEWDKLAIRWGYADDDAALKEGWAKGMRFISDDDARPAGGAHPTAHLWDNGANAAAELDRVMQLRRRALERFGEKAIRPGAPMSSLADVLVPVYLAHRYQVEAASKLVAGLEYNYALRGDGQVVTKLVPGDEQRRALQSLLATIRPEALVLPEALLRVVPPSAFDYDRTRESFGSRTGLTFDPLAAAESAAHLTLSMVLHPQRAARLVQYHARDAAAPSLEEVVGAVLKATLLAPRQTGMAGEVQRTVEGVALYHLMALASNAGAPTRVRAFVWDELDGVAAKVGSGDSMRRHVTQLIKRFQADPKVIPIPAPMGAPPGQPI